MPKVQECLFKERSPLLRGDLPHILMMQRLTWQGVRCVSRTGISHAFRRSLSAVEGDSHADFQPQIKGDPAKAEADVQDEIRKSVEQDPVVLFMKGLPGAPQCGFSYRAVQILNAHDIEFRAYNVLSNDALREGVKKFR